MYKTIIVFLSLIVITLSIIFITKLIKLSSKPNNQYELLIYQDSLQLKDGNRLVKTLKWDSVGQLQQVIEKDNL